MWHVGVHGRLVVHAMWGGRLRYIVGLGVYGSWWVYSMYGNSKWVLRM